MVRLSLAVARVATAVPREPKNRSYKSKSRFQCDVAPKSKRCLATKDSIVLKWLLVFAVVLLSAPMARGQARKPSVRSSDLCVDTVTLRQGKSVRGLIVTGDGQATPWLMAVERETLRQDNPSLFERQAKQEVQKTTLAYEELKKRLQQELTVADLDAGYKSFLESELQRISTELESIRGQAALKTRFTWLELLQKECSDVRRAPVDAQRVAVWAWNENLADVTKRDRADLERELAQSNIDVKLKLPDLSRELPPRPEAEDSWQSRLSIVRYSMAGGIDFQGSAGVYVKAGRGQAAGIAEIGPLIQQMMGGSIESLLAELDPASKAVQKQNTSGNWFVSVTPQAESLGKREFRITRLDQDPSGQSATVETALVAKMPQRGWQIVWSGKQTRQAADVPAAAEEQIASDPQVKSVLSAISALGLNADAEIKKAIRFGAATMAAQKAADSAFLQFRERYLDRLDGPPML